jgi:hypothetical protein
MLGSLRKLTALTVLLDCEGLQKNESKSDVAQLNLVAALLEARHIHCACGAIDRPVMEVLQTLAEFIDQKRPGEKAHLRVAVRTRRVGPQDPAIVAALQSRFNEFDIVVLPEVLQGDPAADPALKAAAASLKSWARSAPTPYTCAELADLLALVVDSNGEPVDVPTIVDHLILSRLRQHLKTASAPVLRQFRDSMPRQNLPSLVTPLVTAINGGSAPALCGRLSVAGATTWRNEVDAFVSAQRTTWNHLLGLYEEKQRRIAADAAALAAHQAALAAQQAAAASEQRRQEALRVAAENERQRKAAQDKLDLIAQREAYNQRRESTKAVTGYYTHPLGWVGGERDWLGRVVRRGCFGCCQRGEGETPCQAITVHTLPEWNDAMFVPKR